MRNSKSVTLSGSKLTSYLLQLTKPFFQFTMALMKTRDMTIHSIFLVCRKLLEHIEKKKNQLEVLNRNKTPWKRAMYDALLAAKPKTERIL